MYPQYGEHRFPPGQEYSAGQARIPVDHARYPYHGFYGPKGADGSPYGGMVSQRGMVGQPYAKHPGIATPDAMYGQGWSTNAINYMNAQSKSAGGPYPMQPDMYPGMRPSTYPDIPPNAISMGGAYSGGANYQGPPNPYMGAGRFPPYQRIAPPPVGMMQQAHAPASPGVTSEGEQSGFSGGSVPPYPGALSRSTTSLTPGRTWSNQDLTQGGSWQQGSYPPGGPSTPGQPPIPTNNSSLTQSHASGQQQMQSPGQQGFTQTNQQSFGPMSPQTPYSNQSQQQLTKQSSISSIRDALLSGTNQSIQGEQNSPLAPAVKPTPDGQLMSPRSVTRQLSTTESISSQDRFSQQPGRQLENNNMVSDSKELNSLTSTPVAGSQEAGDRPDSLGLAAASPSVPVGHLSPSLSVSKMGSESKTPILSPITRNHSSVLNQYSFSDDQQRKGFLDALFAYLEKEGITVSRPPMICKMPLDLYRVYTSVQQHGGFLNVLEKRLWRDVIKSSVSSPSNINSSSTRTLQQYYTKFLLPYECHNTNTDLTVCLTKLEASLSRHTSISSPGSQLSNDDEIRDRIGNHTDSSDNELVIDLQQVNGGDGHLSDKELVSERLGGRVKSNDSNDVPASNGQEATVGTDGGGSNSGGEKDGVEVPENSENSMDSFPQEMMEPLPEMSIQDAESVLGMSPSPYPAQQPPSGGPATPSTNQSVPSPSPFTSQFPRQRSFVEMSGDVNSPMAPPPSYPPSYSSEPTNSPYQISSRPSFPPGYSPHPQYEGGDMHGSGMSQHPYNNMPNSYQGSGGPYPPGMTAQRTMEFPPGVYGPEHMMSQPPGMGMHPDMPPYPGSPHGMHPDWAWQQARSRMLSPLPTHLQPSALHQRYIQQRQQAIMQHNAQARANAYSQARSASDAQKMQWQEQNRISRANIPTHEDKMKALKVSQKPEAVPHSKSSVALKEHSENIKRRLPDWSGCIEGTSPHLMKRRVLFSGDCGHVEPWRVMMSLKSGLLAESTWALDTLNILLHDDRTVGFFYLKHHHSLLNTLVDHFKMTLAEIFAMTFDDTPMYQPGYEGNDSISDSTDDTKDLFSEAMVTDFDVALNITSSTNKDEDEKTSIVPVSNVFDPEEMHLGRSDDMGHVQVPSVDTQLFFPEPDVDLSIMPQSKRKQLEDCSKLHRVDQTPVNMLLKRELIMSQIPLHRNGRPLRSPRGRERSFMEEMRRRESIGRADVEGSSTSTKDTTTSGDLRKEPAVVNHSVRSRLDSVFTSQGRSHGLSPPTLVEEYEIHHKEPTPLWTVSPSREKLQSRCLCISNILRSLSFIPGNDHEFSQHAGILLILGRLLLLHHDHLIHSKRKAPPLRPSSLPEEKKSSLGEKLTLKHEEKFFPPCEDYWWWTCLDGLREDTLVILSNVSGQLDLSIFPELICYPIIDGLLHWSVCPSSLATDPLPDTAVVTSLSPQRLVLETLSKMSISEVNVDLILATPPLTRLDLLFTRLGQFIGDKRHPVVRQFALVLLSNLAQGNDASSRLIGQQKMIGILLLQCLEFAEHSACSSGGKLVGGYNPEDPNSLSVAMLRRAATTLHCLSKIPANRTILLCHRDRILYLCASQYIEHSVSSILMDVLFELGKL